MNDRTQSEPAYGELGPRFLPFTRNDVQKVQAGVPDLSTHSFNTEVASYRALTLDSGEYKTLVCDLDGTLVNSEPAILQCIFEAAEQMISQDLGQEFSFSPLAISTIKTECFGRGDAEMSIKLLTFIRASDIAGPFLLSVSDTDFIAAFKEQRKDRFIEMCKNGYVYPMPGAIEFIEKAFKAFGPLALNTGSPEIIATAELESVLGDYIDVDSVFPIELRTFGNQVGSRYGKPDPLGYTMAAVKLNCSPNRLVAIVDRPNDAVSALHAGYGKVIIVPEDMDTETFISGPHSVIDYLSELPDENLLKNPERVLLTGGLDWLNFHRPTSTANHFHQS